MYKIEDYSQLKIHYFLWNFEKEILHDGPSAIEWCYVEVTEVSCM